MRLHAKKILYLAATMLLCIGLFSIIAWGAESYSASSMRLLHYEGEVEILNADGEPRFVLENVRFDSGETMTTGKESTASVELEEDRIVTLDAETSVEFIQKGDSMTMNLKEGTILLDVKNKLDKNQTLDIQTSNMTVGIRGTAVYVINIPAGDERLNNLSKSSLAKILPLLDQEASEIQSNADGSVTVFGVVQGNADITWNDSNGGQRTMNIQEGTKAILIGAAGEDTFAGPVVAPVENDDVTLFLGNNLTEDRSSGLQQLLSNRGDSASDPYAPDGTWSYCGTVTLVAQSASKMYDGTPLTERDILVSGLPEGFSITAETSGSQLDAGTSDNPISKYTIYNYRGEEVTDHFTNVETVDGQLVVDPVSVTVHTGSAERVYNGLALTSNEAEITTIATSQQVKTGQNISYINTQPFGEIPGSGSAAAGTDETLADQEMQVLYGLIGETTVHGTNPLTGETREIVLTAGQRLTVSLNEGEDGESIEYLVEKMKEEDIPEDVLRMYADNPDLLAQACEEAGWDPDKMQELINLLPAAKESLVEENGIMVRKNDTGSTLQDYTNVWIDVDTDITDYNGRSLGSDEASFMPIKVESSIKVTATGSQTWVGQSRNTYTIDWGDAKKENYAIAEDLGTLKVTAAPITVTTGSASKTYDGTALTSSSATITGLVGGETATVTATGSQTDVGSSANTYTINWISANAINYAVTENLGTLTVTPAPAAPTYDVTITTGSASKTYDGTPLTSSEITVTGLPEGASPVFTLTGTITDAGEATNTYTVDWGGLDPSNLTITENLGTLTVTKAAATVTTSSETKAYDGAPLTGSASITGLAAGDSVTLAATGTITEVGTTANTYSISWDNAKETNYTVTDSLGTLKVTTNDTEITFTAVSASKAYDGTPLIANVSVSGLPESLTFVATTTGSQTDVGTSTSTVDSYTIYDAAGNDKTANFTNVKTADGTLEVTKNNNEVVFTSASGSKPYDGTPLYIDTITVTGLPAGLTWVASTGDWTGPHSPNAGFCTNDFNDMEYSGVDEAGNTYYGTRIYAIYNGEKDVTSYFTNVTVVKGILTITPAPLTVTTGSASKTFDFQTLKCDSPELCSIDGLVNGETAELSVTGSQTAVGFSDNTYTINWGTAVSSNYAIIENLGTLTVDPTTLTIDAGGGTYPLDVEEITYYPKDIDLVLGENLHCVEKTVTPSDGGKTLTAVYNFPETTITIVVQGSGSSLGDHQITCSFSAEGDTSWYVYPYNLTNDTITIYDPESLSLDDSLNRLLYHHADGSVTSHTIYGSFAQIRQTIASMAAQNYPTAAIFNQLVNDGLVNYSGEIETGEYTG